MCLRKLIGQIVCVELQKGLKIENGIWFSEMRKCLQVQALNSFVFLQFLNRFERAYIALNNVHKIAVRLTEKMSLTASLIRELFTNFVRMHT